MAGTEIHQHFFQIAVQNNNSASLTMCTNIYESRIYLQQFYLHLLCYPDQTVMPDAPWPPPSVAATLLLLFPLK